MAFRDSIFWKVFQVMLGFYASILVVVACVGVIVGFLSIFGVL